MNRATEGSHCDLRALAASAAAAQQQQQQPRLQVSIYLGRVVRELIYFLFFRHWATTGVSSLSIAAALPVVSSLVVKSPISPSLLLRLSRPLPLTRFPLPQNNIIRTLQTRQSDEPGTPSKASVSPLTPNSPRSASRRAAEAAAGGGNGGGGNGVSSSGATVGGVDLGGKVGGGGGGGGGGSSSSSSGASGRSTAFRVLALLVAAACLSALAAHSFGAAELARRSTAAAQAAQRASSALPRKDPSAPAAAGSNPAAFAPHLSAIYSDEARGLEALCTVPGGGSHSSPSSGGGGRRAGPPGVAAPAGSGAPPPPGSPATVWGAPPSGMVPCMAPDASPGADAAARIGQPKVALLFLTASDIPHERTWAAWLRASAGLLRADCVAQAVCPTTHSGGGVSTRTAGAHGLDADGAAGSTPAGPPRRRALFGAGGETTTAHSAASALASREAAVAALEAADAAATREAAREFEGVTAAAASADASAAAAAATAADGGDENATALAAEAAAAASAATAALNISDLSSVLASQHLFSVFVHTPPNVTLKAGSPFAGREVPGRVRAAWGDHSVVEATRALLRAALADPLNQRFVLLSEADAPLYSAAATYAQLMSEPKSRINACAVPGQDRELKRFTPRMETPGPHGFKKENWRKSSQWWTLNRRAADALGADEAIDASFKAHCVNGFDEDRGENRWCVFEKVFLFLE